MKVAVWQFVLSDSSRKVSSAMARKSVPAASQPNRPAPVRERRGGGPAQAVSARIRRGHIDLGISVIVSGGLEEQGHPPVVPACRARPVAKRGAPSAASCLLATRNRTWCIEQRALDGSPFNRRKKGCIAPPSRRHTAPLEYPYSRRTQMRKELGPRLLASSMLAAVAGCATTTLFDQRSLSDVWSEQLAKYRITPVFPPGEDFQIGDVLIACSAPYSAAGYVPSAPVPQRVMRVRGVQAALQTYYSSSVRLLPDSSIPSIQEADGKLKMRNLSLPEFFQVRASGSQLGALLPFGTTLAGIGLATSDVDSVDVSVPAAGSVALPLQEMINLVNGSGMDGSSLDALVDQYKKTCPKDEKGNQSAAAIIVSEVYAAYGISLSITLTKARAAQASVALAIPSDSTRKASFDALKDYFARTPGDSAGGGASIPPSAVAAVAAAASTASAAAKASADAASSSRSAANSATAAASAAAAASSPAAAASAAKAAAAAASSAASAAGEAALAASQAASAAATVAKAASSASGPPPDAMANFGQNSRDQQFISSLLTLMNGTRDSFQTSHPGVNISVYSGSNSGVRMDRKFAEPVIIGLRFFQVSKGENNRMQLTLPGIVISPPASIF